MKKFLWLMLWLLFAIALCAAEPGVQKTAALPETVPASMTAAAAAPHANPTEKPALKDGYALLNSLHGLFAKLMPEKKAVPGAEKVTKSGLALVDEKISQLARDSQASLKSGLVDKIFCNRYQRMLTIYKLVITPMNRNEMLENLFMKAFEEFVWDTTYERWAPDDCESIPKMAAAMEEEFVQLMIYLDTKQKREELKKKMDRRMLPPPPPYPSGSEKKAEQKKPA